LAAVHLDSFARPASQFKGASMSLPVESPVLSKHRLEALADGIFAFALTLLVLDLRLPALPPGVDDAALRQALAGLLPKATIWLLSFAVIAASWVVQQRTFALLSKIDPDLLRIELILLALVSLFPFSQSCKERMGISRLHPSYTVGIYCASPCVRGAGLHMC
jgi:uncharacterized membrane protein